MSVTDSKLWRIPSTPFPERSSNTWSLSTRSCDARFSHAFQETEDAGDWGRRRLGTQETEDEATSTSLLRMSTDAPPW